MYNNDYGTYSLNGIVINGDYNIVTGTACIINGDYNNVSGANCIINGDYNLVSGANCINNGDYNNFSKTNIRSNLNSGIAVQNNYGSGIRVNSFGVNGFTTHYVSTEAPKHKEAEPKYIEGPTLSDLEHDKKQEDDNGKTCCICLDNIPICIAFPCMHLVYCVSCSRTLCFGSNDTETLKQHGELACAECRAEVRSIKRVFQ